MSTHTKVMPSGIIRSQKKARRALTAYITMDYKQYCRLMWVRRRKGKKREQE